MKRLFLLLILSFMVPSGTFGRPATGPSVTLGLSKEEKELEKRVKGMTKDDAERILLQSELSPPREGGWQLTRKLEDAFMFKATKGINSAYQLRAAAALHEGKLLIVFNLDNPYRLMELEVIDKDYIVARFTRVSGINNDGYPIEFLYQKSQNLALLNAAFIPVGEGKVIQFSRILATRKSIAFWTKDTISSWQLNNPEAIYAAALMLKPDLTFDEYLATMSVKSK